MRKKTKGGTIKPSKMGNLPQGNKAFGQHADQKSGMTRGKNLGDAGKKVAIQKEVKMAKGGKTKRMFTGGLDAAVADGEGPRRSPVNIRLVSPEAQTASGDTPKTIPKATAVKKATPTKKSSESATSRANRLAAYEDWVKTKHDPMAKSYLKTGTADADNDGDASSDTDADGMKKGGKVKGKTCMKTGGIARGDGVAQRGKTRGRYC